MENDRHKFRVWCLEHNEWEDGNCLLDSRGNLWIKTGMGFLPLKKETHIVEHCTGLSASKSYRGNKPEDLLIWEGDKCQKIEREVMQIGELAAFKETHDVIKVDGEQGDKAGYCKAFYRGKIDIATMERFPCYWLKDEGFGYEGEDLESPEDWEIIGNVHEVKA